MNERHRTWRRGGRAERVALEQAVFTVVEGVTELDVDRWANGQIERAKAMLTEDGTLTPVLLFLAPHRDDPRGLVQGVVPTGAFLSGQTPTQRKHNRGQLVRVARRLLGEARAFASLMISEGWATAASPGEDFRRQVEQIAAVGGVAQMPKRFEIVMTSFETTKTQTHRAWVVQRDPDGTPRVTHELPGFASIEVSFAPLLVDPPSAGSSN